MSEPRLRLGVRSIPEPGDGWINALPGLEHLEPGARVNMLRDAPHELIWWREGRLGCEYPDPERPAWRLGDLHLSHASCLAACTLLEVAPPATLLGARGPELLDLLRRARSLRPSDAARAPAEVDPDHRLWRKIMETATNRPEIERACGFGDSIDSRWIAQDPGGTEGSFNLAAALEGAVIAVVAEGVSRSLLDQISEAWAPFASTPPSPDAWAAADPDPDPAADPFRVWTSALTFPPLISTKQWPPDDDLALLWPLGWTPYTYDGSPRPPWIKVTRAYPTEGPVLEVGTHLRHVEDFAYEVVGTGQVVDQMTLEYGPFAFCLVAPDEPMLTEPDGARALYERLVELEAGPNV